MTETFRYKYPSIIGEDYNTESIFLIEEEDNMHLFFVRLLDVLRAKGVLTGWDVCEVLGGGVEPCSSDMPPPWDPTP
jgi:hypothetical protein